MRKIRNAVFAENKGLNIAILSISGFMLLISLFSLSFVFADDVPYVELKFNELASLISVCPLSFGVSTVLLMKTKKHIFAKLPSYIVCTIIAVAYVIYFISLGDDIVTGVMGLVFVAFIVYPFIVAVLTIEGRVYNRVFATAFSGLLIFISLAAFVVLSIYLKTIMLSLLLPALIYLQLLLTVLSFRLEPIKKQTEQTEF